MTVGSNLDRFLASDTIPTGARTPAGLIGWALVAAVLSAALLFYVLWVEQTTSNARERLQLVELTNSFVSTFSEARNSESLIPAEFRRLGIEHFTNSDQAGAGTVVRMPGRPGLAIGQTEPDPRLAQMILSFVDDPSREPRHEHRFEEGRLIARTLVPSIAASESCVACHNQILERDVYALGDLMGAYIVETEITDSTIVQAKIALVWLAVSFLLFRAIGTWARSRKLQMMHLSARIELEEMKNASDSKERFLLSHDALTGLANRKLFNDHLNSLFEADGFEGLVAMLVDLDDFKAVNDTYGHAVGDALLVEVAARLKEATQPVEAMVARLGGDEFALVWRAVDAKTGAADIAAKVLDAVVRPITIEGWACNPKCSIGVASWGRGRFESPSDLLKSADAALYVAKERGKNTYQLYDEAVDATVRRRRTISSALVKAIRNREIDVVFQPQVALMSGQFSGFEALARWSLAGEPVPPDEFVQIAEDVGIVRELDLFVLKEAIRFAQMTANELGHPVPVSVNFSAKTCQNIGISEEVQDILLSVGYPTDQLTIEVTETSVIEQFDLVRSVLQAFRDMGVRTALDDFGTGYSSLSYLTTMKFDVVKIDRGFVRDLAEGNDTHTLLLHLADLVSSLGMGLVIEGIETQTQADLVCLGPTCVGQGYFYSKPLASKPAIAFLRAFAEGDRCVLSMR